MGPKFVTNKYCKVCNHINRDEIEAVLYRMTSANADELLQKLSDEYEVDIEELERHAMFHACMDLSPQGEETSIVRQIKLRETDLLNQVAKDYADTLTLVGTRIRQRALNEAGVNGMEDTKFERAMTKGMVELYLGCGDNVRKTVKDIVDINQVLNGPKDEGLSGLGALAAAIAGSRQPAATAATNSEEQLDIFDMEDGES